MSWSEWSSCPILPRRSPSDSSSAGNSNTSSISSSGFESNPSSMSASVSSSCSRLERTWAASRRNAHSDPSDWPDALFSPYLSEGRKTGRNALVPARLRVATLWYVKSAASTDSTSVSTLSPKMVELVLSAAGGEGESVRVRADKGRERDVNEDGPSTSVWSSSRSTSLDGVTRATQSCGPQILAERARSAEWRPPNEDRVDCRACKKVSFGSKRGGEARRDVDAPCRRRAQKGGRYRGA